jgi:hypothetical protein
MQKHRSETEIATPATRPRPPTLKEVGLDALSLVLIAILVPMMVYLDTVVLFGGMTEFTLTEFTQAGLIGLTAVLFFAGARSHPDAAGYLMLVATFAAMMFVRENDVHLDHVWHGFWALPALMVFLGGVAFAFLRRDTIRPGLLQHAATREAGMFLAGLITLLFFSRIFGSGNIWRDVLGADYSDAFKATIQEGIELYGFALIAYAAWRSWQGGFGRG